MGSHRARHRADQNQSEELATDLLARLADEARPRQARTRHAAERPTLDPFSTAPFPARKPRTADDPATPDAAAAPDSPPPDAVGPGSTIPAPRSSSTPAHNGTASGPGGVGGPGTPDGPGGPGAPGSARIPAPRSPAAPGDTAGPGDAAGADGAATPCSPPQAAQNPLGLRSGPAAELSAGYGYELDPAASVPTPRFPSDPGAPFPSRTPRWARSTPPGRAATGSPPSATSRSTSPCPPR